MKNYLKGIWKLSSTIHNSAENQLEVALKREQVFICDFTLPIMPAKDLEEAVRWELPLYVPLTEGTYTYDYRKLGIFEGMQRVQVVAVEKSVIAQLVEEAKEKDKPLTAIRVEGYEDFNLLPKEYLRVPKQRLYQYGIAVALSLAVVCCTGGYVYKTIQLRNLNILQQRIKDMSIWQRHYDEQQRELQKIKMLQTALANLEKERIIWSNVLPILGESTPKECWLTEVKQREEKNFFELRGKATSMEQVQKFLDNLQATNKFKNISLLEAMEAKNELLGYRILLCKRVK